MGMKTRREIMISFAGASIAGAASQVSAESSPTIEICRQRAGQLAEAMEEICGGQWRVSVDKNLEFILISKVL